MGTSIGSIFNVPDQNAGLADLRKIAEDFIKYGEIPSNYTTDDLIEMIKTGGNILVDKSLKNEEDTFWANLDRLALVLKDLEFGK